FNDDKNLKTLEELKSLGLQIENPDYEEKTKPKPLEGLTFVITGTHPVPRKEIEDLIESLGGHVASAVSRKTDYLIVGEEPGSKLQKAIQLGIKRINYDEFQQLIKERSREEVRV
ncbi:MAG: NAD-dependent DNA ligase LigA, partial [Nitrospirae bacterium]